MFKKSFSEIFWFADIVEKRLMVDEEINLKKRRKLDYY